MIDYKHSNSRNLIRAEIFRHFRPTWFDKNRAVVSPLPNGGISFLFLPVGAKSDFNYWIYVCPDDAIFSAKVAVSKLREVAIRGVKPWGTITLAEDSLLDTAVKSVIKEEGDLPTTASKQAFKTFISNLSVDRLYQLYMSGNAGARKEYEEDIVR